MGAAGLLPRNKAPFYHNSDAKPSSNTWVKALIVVMCCLNAYYCISSLQPSCPPIRQLLSTGEAAATAALEATTRQHLFDADNAAQEQQQQFPAAVESSCAVKVEDISSWASTGLTEGPFQFPKIIFQTVEHKANVSCEALSCIQTWMDMNPGYEHRLVDAAERRQFVADHYPEVRGKGRIELGGKGEGGCAFQQGTAG
jgi:mannosyltransferase OCH1-like enzyme